MRTATKRTVEFIATKYRDKPIQVNFYTKNGETVKFIATEKVPAKAQSKFKTRK